MREIKLFLRTVTHDLLQVQMVQQFHQFQKSRKIKNLQFVLQNLGLIMGNYISHAAQAAAPTVNQILGTSNDATKEWDDIKDNYKIEDLDIVYPPEPKSDKSKIRIVCISDTHSTQFRQNFPVIPDGDILIHAGDFSNCGGLAEVRKFNEWMGSLPHKHKIVIAGNHELSFDPRTKHSMTNHRYFFKKAEEFGTVDGEMDVRKELSNVTYLQDEEVQVMGLKIYGSPWQPEFHNWGFNLKRGPELQEKWQQIPDDTDILVTHGPPLGHGDLCHGRNNRVGCKDLLHTITERVRPKLHVCGHIHEDYGLRTNGTTLFANASICQLSLKPLNKPIVIDI